jgi:hypothetical protein
LGDGAKHGTVRIVSPREAVEAAHDPALGLERSVRLGDVIEAIKHAYVHGTGVHKTLCGDFLDAAAFIERTFTVRSSTGDGETG